MDLEVVLGSSEHKEIEKYIKFFTLKSVQCIITSRTGCSTNTKCNPTAKGVDWFNISLADHNACKNFYATIHELFGRKTPGLCKPVCLDVILKTSEGNFIVLESWQVSANVANKEEHLKNPIPIYNRLGVLLKSVATVSRLLPCYELTRRGHNDFTLFYKVHSETYSVYDYELDEVLRIGSVRTPVGEVTMTTLYRSNICETRSITSSLVCIMYDMLFPFSVEESAGNEGSGGCGWRGSDVDVECFSPYLSDWFAMSSVPNSRRGSAATLVEIFGNPDSRRGSLVLDNGQVEGILGDRCIGPHAPIQQQTSNDSQTVIHPPIHMSDESLHDETTELPVAAFAESMPLHLANLPNLDLPELPATPPFSSLFQDLNDPKIISFLQEDLKTSDESNPSSSKNTKSDPSHESASSIESPLESPNNSHLESSLIQQRQPEAVGFEDDFVLVELRPAFCLDTDTVGSLFRQCQSPCGLDIFDMLEKEDAESESIDLDTQLEKYRKELEQFDSYFKANIY